MSRYGHGDRQSRGWKGFPRAWLRMFQVLAMSWRKGRSFHGTFPPLHARTSPERPVAPSTRVPRRAGRRDAGFSLLEVMVALVVASLALGILVRAIGLGLAAARSERDMAEAVARARSRLAEFTGARSLSPGVRGGQDDNGYLWQVRVERVGVAPAWRALRLKGGFQALDTALFQITVSISWPEGGVTRALTLTDHVLIAVGQRI